MIDKPYVLLSGGYIIGVEWHDIPANSIKVRLENNHFVRV